MFIYAVMCVEDGSIVYIGQSTDFLKRVRRHRWDAQNGRGYAFAAALAKHGEYAFQFRPIMLVDDPTLADEFEVALIAAVRPRYNLDPGGHQRHRGGSKTPWNKGKTDVYSPGTRQRMGSHSVGVEPPNKGVAHTPETRALIKAKRASQRMTNNKPFKCLQTGVIYRTLADAAADLGVAETAVCKVLTGAAIQAKGYTFSHDLSAEQMPSVPRTRKQASRVIKDLTTGEFFAGSRAAAEALGCCPQLVDRAVKTGTSAKGHRFSTDLAADWA